MSSRSTGTLSELLLRLNDLLDRLSAPESLDADDLSEMMRVWDRDMGELEVLTARFPDGVTPGDGTRERLVRFVKRIAEVQPLLLHHKSEVADQLFSENRRVQALRRGYGAEVGGTTLFHHKA
ncbi:MAG: hypothetical protein H7834_07325 [Magnetococcus sp. YQC-9]